MTARFRPILHVLIETDVVPSPEGAPAGADVDAFSTADAMAYFLQSRGLDPDATEGSIALDVMQCTGKAPGPRATIITERRDLGGGTRWAYAARTKDDAYMRSLR